MRSRNGQALLEFVLILPILIMLSFAMIDLGKISYEMNRLESIISSATFLYNNNTSIKEIETKLESDYDISLNISLLEDEDKTTITLKREIKLMTPLASTILPNPYNVEIKRVVYNE